uniref:Uncharacterized protein n=1 Tax=Trichuris muris TaxID=70415 RepID=A0A5S6PZN0_TRIMR
MMEGKSAAHGFSALIDEFRIQFHDRMTSMLREFDDFEFEMKRSEEMVEEDKRRRDGHLTEMRRKYPRWSLPVSVGAKEQSGKRSLESSARSHSQVNQLRAEVDQLKWNFQNLSVKFADLEKSTDISRTSGAAALKDTESALPKYDAKASHLVNGKQETAESVSSDDDRFVELNFASVSKPRLGVTSLRDHAKAVVGTAERPETGSTDTGITTPLPTRFAFDQNTQPDGNALRQQAMYPNETATAKAKEQSSVRDDDSPGKLSDVSSSLSRPSASNLPQAATREIPAHTAQDDFMAKLFPDKFGVKQRNETTREDILSLKDDSDSDFFA